MRKYVLGALALTLGFFTSCKNDDINIDTVNETKTYQDVTLKITPETVISGFSDDAILESYVNQLGNYNLRVRSLVYDENGDLYSYNCSFVDSYSTIVNFDVKLVQGKKYTIFTTTDLVRGLNASTKAYSSQFWELKDSTKLSSVKVCDAGYIGGDSKILGADCRTITCGTESTINVAPQIQGAMVFNYYIDGSTNHSAQYMSLLVKKMSDNIQLSNNNIEYNFKTDDYRLTSAPYIGTKSTDNSGNTIYYGIDYSFLFCDPTSPNIPVKFDVWYDFDKRDGDSFDIWNTDGTAKITSYAFEKGKEYCFMGQYYDATSTTYSSNAWLMTYQEYLKLFSSSSKQSFVDTSLLLKAPSARIKSNYNIKNELSAKALLK